MNRNDPYLRQLRRELIQAQARLKRVEHERDELKRLLVKRDNAIAMVKRLITEVIGDVDEVVSAYQGPRASANRRSRTRH